MADTSKKMEAIEISMSRRRIDNGFETVETNFCPNPPAFDRLECARHGTEFAVIGESKKGRSAA
jgi:hypothetical protein